MRTEREIDAGHGVAHANVDHARRTPPALDANGRRWDRDPRHARHVRELTAASLEPRHPDAITNARPQAAEYGEHATPETRRAELSALEVRLLWRLITVGIDMAGSGVAVVRLPN